MARSSNRLAHIKMRRLLQSKRGKLVFVLSIVLMIFLITSVVNRIANTHTVWHFDCYADSYFSHQGESSLKVDKSNLWLSLDIDHHQAKLIYKIESSVHGTEIAQLVGKVDHVDMGSFTYHLGLTLQPTLWQTSSRLKPYLHNEFGIMASQKIVGVSIAQQVQVIDLDNALTSATLKFLPSNNVWSCQLRSPDTAH